MISRSFINSRRQLLQARSWSAIVPKHTPRLTRFLMTCSAPQQQRMRAAARSPFHIERQQTRLSSTTAAIAGSHCPGCGAPFQFIDSDRPGYYVEREPKPVRERKRSNHSLSADEYEAALQALDADLQAALLNEEDFPDTEAGTATSIVDPDAIDPTAPEQQQPVPHHQHQQEKEDAKRVICERCYLLEHRSTSQTSPQFLRATQQYASLEFLKTKQNPLIVVVLDVSDLPSSLPPLPVNSGARLILAANKVDLLPERARRHEQRIRDWIVQHVKHYQDIPTSQIRHVSLLSATKGWGIQGLLRKIDEERLPTDDVYIVGATNVGKSALVNQIVSQQRVTDKKRFKITSSPAPGTTMGTIRIPLHAIGLQRQHQHQSGGGRLVQRDRFLVDTPGIINDQQLIHLLPFEEQKTLLRELQRPLKPVTFRLEPGKSLLLKPFIRLDLVHATDPVLITLFTPLSPHLANTAKLDAKLDAKEEKEEDENTPTSSSSTVLDPKRIQLDSLQPMPQLLTVRGQHKSRASVDLAFASMGWVAVAGLFDKAQFKIWLPTQVDAEKALCVRDPPMLPFEYQGVLRKFFGSGDRARK